MLIDEEFTLKKLEIFLAFMRTGNLARAAAELQTSNVSVHRAIHSLESALRCPLFKHEGRNLTPLESAYVLEERAQKLVADEVIREIADSGTYRAPVVTEVLPLANYSAAEAYHQDYFVNHPNQGYCAFVVGPKVEKFQKTFAARVKD